MFLAPLNYQVAKMVAKAQSTAKAAGKSIVIYDAFRSLDAQKQAAEGLQGMFDANPSFKDEVLDGWAINWFIATGASNHQMGIAIDCALCTVNSSADVTVGDTTVSIPESWSVAGAYSPMHELSAESAKYASGTSSTFSDEYQSNANAKELHEIMTGAGMRDLKSEWWHFQGWKNQDAPQRLVNEILNNSSAQSFEVSACLSTAPDDAESAGGTAASGASGAGESGGPTGGGSGSSGGTGTGGTGTGGTGTGGTGTGGTGTGSGTGSGSGGTHDSTSNPDAEYAKFQSKEFMTDENGKLSLQWWDASAPNYIPPGQYTVTEVNPPEGYELSTESKHLVLAYDEDTGVATCSGPLVFYNNPLKKIEVHKVDKDGKPLAGAVFDVLRNGAKIGSCTTDDSGTCIWDGADGAGLQEGYYIFEEVKAPPGKVLPKIPRQGVWVTPKMIDDDEVISLTFINYDEPDIMIRKLVNGTPVGIAGAVFEVMIDGEVLPGRFVTNNDGTINITYAEYGDYVDPDQESWTVSVREVTPPDGYLLDDDQWQTVEVHRGLEVADFVFTDTKYPEIKIIKRDVNHPEKKLAGARFEVTIDGQTIDTLTTNDLGEILIDYATYGRFLHDGGTDEEWFTIGVREVGAPETEIKMADLCAKILAPHPLRVRG